MNTDDTKKNHDVRDESLLAERLQQSPNGWFGIRVLRLAMRYPYMFSRRNFGLEMCIEWSPIFSQLCADLDSLLGQDKRKFCWHQLTQAKGAPVWYWRLNTGRDQHLYTSEEGRIDLAAMNPGDDQMHELRCAVSGMISAAIEKIGLPCPICAQTNEGIQCE